MCTCYFRTFASFGNRVPGAYVPVALRVLRGAGLAVVQL